MSMSFNYALLSPLDFEGLCKDVLSALTGKKLRVFPEGRDKGIDINTDSLDRAIVGQSKRFEASSYSSLKKAFTNSIAAFVKNYPGETPDYYLLTSLSLSQDRILELMSLSQGLITCPSHIFGKEKLDDILTQDLNQSRFIIRSNPALFGTGAILASLFGIDRLSVSEERLFLRDIEESAPVFVRTQAFIQAEECLKNNHGVFLTGSPGSGKSITSRMLVAALIAAHPDYRLVVGEHSASGRLSSLCDETQKQIVILDDVLGAVDYDFTTADAGSLAKLIRIANLYPTTYLILNSRQTILSQAKEKAFANIPGGFPLQVVDCDSLTSTEKELIIYKHAALSQLPDECLRQICKGHGFRRLASEPGYNPRIIEKAMRKSVYDSGDHTNYLNRVLQSMRSPFELWRDEFENRLVDNDRWILYLIASFGKRSLSYDNIVTAFKSLSAQIPGRLPNMNLLGKTLSKLCDEFLSCKQIAGVRGSKKYAFINPSVFEVVKSSLFSDELEEVRKRVEASAVFFEQKVFMDPAYCDSEEFTLIIKNGDYEKIRSIEKGGGIVVYVQESLVRFDLAQNNTQAFFDALKRLPTYVYFVSSVVPKAFLEYVRKCDLIQLRSDFLDEEVLDSLYRLVDNHQLLCLYEILASRLNQDDISTLEEDRYSEIHGISVSVAQFDFENWSAPLIPDDDMVDPKGIFAEKWNSDHNSMASLNIEPDELFIDNSDEETEMVDEIEEASEDEMERMFNNLYDERTQMS